MIAQANFEEKYTFKELDCSEIVKDLVVRRQ